MNKEVMGEKIYNLLDGKPDWLSYDVYHTGFIRFTVKGLGDIDVSTSSRSLYTMAKKVVIKMREANIHYADNSRAMRDLEFHEECTRERDAFFESAQEMYPQLRGHLIESGMIKDSQ